MNITSWKHSTYRGLQNAQRSCLWRTCFLALSVLTCLASVRLLDAQVELEIGNLKGRVYNVETGNYVEGAEVYVEGTSKRTTTNRLGRYEIRDLQSGPVTIKAVVRGIAAQRAEATVTAGETVSVADIGIGGEDDVFELDAFTVDLNEEVHALEIAMQRDAPNVITAIGTDAYGNVGSNSVGNLLQYVPGLTIEGFDGEAHTVSVRGMDPAYGSITSDGAKLAGQAEGGGGLNRASYVLDIGLVNFSEIEVIKAPTPDKAADSTGGVINLRTRSVFASRQPHSGRVSFGLSSTLRDGAEFQSIDPNVTFNYRQLLGEDTDDAKWGFTLNGAYSTRYLVRDQTTISYEPTFETRVPGVPFINEVGKQVGHQELNRRSFGGNLEFRPSENTTYLLGYKYNGSDRFSDNRTVTWNSRGNGVGVPVLPAGYDTTGALYNGSVRVAEGYTDNEVFWPRARFWARNLRNKQSTEQHVLRFAGDHEFGPWKVSYDVNRSTYALRARESKDWGGVTQLFMENVGVKVTGYKDSPDFDVEYVGGKSPDDYARYNSITFDDWNQNFSDNEVWSGRLDVTRFLDIERAPTYVKAGLNFQSGTQDQIPTEYNRYTFEGDLSGYSFDDMKERFGWDSPERRADANYNPIYSDWEEFYPGLLDSEAVRADLFRQNMDDWSDGARINGGWNRSRGWGEDVSAAYAMATTKLFEEKVTLLGGARYEETKVTAYDNYSSDPIEGTSFNSDSDTYSDFFPSFHVTWEFLSGWQARLSYSTSIGRVNPGSIIPNTTITPAEDGPFGRIDIVNVGLKPRYVDNYETSIEYYPDNGGRFSIGYFQKDMESFIYSINEIIGSGSDNGFDGEYAGWTLRTQANGGEGEVKGWEMDYRSPSLGEFVSWLEGFTVFANYTKLKASGDYGDGGDDVLSGFKPETGNVGIAYRKGGTSVQLRSNFRGEYLRFPNGNPVLSRWEYDQTKFDINFEQKITDSMSFYLDLINFTNTNGRRYYGDPDVERRLGWVDDNGPEIYSGINYIF